MFSRLLVLGMDTSIAPWKLHKAYMCCKVFDADIWFGLLICSVILLV